MKLVASHFGGTRNPLVISWPDGIAADTTPRPQFTHVVDIAPTIYEVLGIAPPEEVNGFAQDPIDGTSMVYSFSDPAAPTQHTEQYFENNGSRALWQDGWVAAVRGPFEPWDTASSGAALRAWDANADVWELYDITSDFSQAHDLATGQPDWVAAMQARFLEVAEDNKVFPIGGGNWLRLHPEDRITTPYTEWVFDEATTRMPEFTAPGQGRESNVVTIDATFGDAASGVLYALGGAGGGLALYLDEGTLVYEYNMFILERTEARAAAPIAAGRHEITVATTIEKPGAAAEVVLSVDGAEMARASVPRTVPTAFSASETLDVGIDLGSPVARPYFERRPFAFDGQIETVKVSLAQ
jgi:arylsulfatase